MTKKRYCGIDEEGKLHATGLEVKRTDWTVLAQNIQEELLTKILLYDATEEELNDYINYTIDHIRSFSVDNFVFEKIVDCRKKFKANTRIVKAWQSCGFQVETSEEDGKKVYQCISPRGEVLLGIRWLYDDKGKPVGIPEDESLELFKSKIGYDWYIKNQILPIAKRVTNSLSFRLGKKQKDLFGELTYV